jgi:hypothetical protein
VSSKNRDNDPLHLVRLILEERERTKRKAAEETARIQAEKAEAERAMGANVRDFRFRRAVMLAKREPRAVVSELFEFELKKEHKEAIEGPNAAGKMLTFLQRNREKSIDAEKYPNLARLREIGRAMREAREAEDKDKPGA